jgi:hypothetical protein
VGRSYWPGIAAFSLSAIACTMPNPAFRSDGSDGHAESVSGSATGGASLESGSHDTSTTRDTSDSQSGDANTKGSDVTSDATASDATSSETSETRGGTDGSDASDDRADTAACDPLTEDASSIHEPCQSLLDCADDAYTCLEIVGIVEQQRCAILCEDDCECPDGHSCVMNSDMVKEWHECM